MQTAAASLVAAIPAGILATLLVMMFLTHSENLKPAMMGAAGATLLFTAVVVLLPFGILLFSGKSAAKAAAKTSGKAGAKADDAEDAEVSASEDLLVDEEEEFGETVVFDPDSSNDLADLADDEFDESTEEDLFEEEDEPPKKKGKKKKN